MFDQQQIASQQPEDLAQRAKKLREQLEGRMVGADLTPYEHSFVETLNGILDILEDLGKGGIDPGTY